MTYHWVTISLKFHSKYQTKLLPSLNISNVKPCILFKLHAREYTQKKTPYIHTYTYRHTHTHIHDYDQLFS